MDFISVFNIWGNYYISYECDLSCIAKEKEGKNFV